MEFFPEDSGIPEDMDVDLVNTEPAHLMTNTSLYYSQAGGAWSLNGYIKNIENHAKKTGLSRGDLRIGSPRTIGAVLSVRF